MSDTMKKAQDWTEKVSPYIRADAFGWRIGATGYHIMQRPGSSGWEPHYRGRKLGDSATLDAALLVCGGHATEREIPKVEITDGAGRWEKDWRVTLRGCDGYPIQVWSDFMTRLDAMEFSVQTFGALCPPEWFTEINEASNRKEA